jgi:hypothetical protein
MVISKFMLCISNSLKNAKKDQLSIFSSRNASSRGFSEGTPGGMPAFAGGMDGDMPAGMGGGMRGAGGAPGPDVCIW